MANYRYRGRRGGQVGFNRELDYTQRFLIASAFRFMRNMVERYQGHIHDDDFFCPVADRLTPEAFRRIFNASTTPALRRALLELDKDEKVNLAKENPKEILQKLWEHPQSNPKFRAALDEHLQVELVRIQASLRSEPSTDAERFAKLAEFFKLSESERDLLLLGRLAEGFWSCDELHGALSYGKFNRFASAIGVSDAELQRISKPDARLRKLECVDEDLDFNKDLLPYLSGADDTPLEDTFFKPYSGEILPWEFFGELAQKHGAILSALLHDKKRTAGLHILFYGAPGTGKTSFAAALAEKLGRTAYFIDQKRGSRFAALQVCELQRDKDSSLIVIDEADKLLDCSDASFFGITISRKNGDKAELNNILDSVKTPCIWIANTPASSLDESNRRRFDYSIEFKPLTTANRERIWKNAAQKHAVTLSDDIIASLAARYPVSAGGIELALRNAAALDGNNLEEKIGSILTPHCELMQTAIGKASEVAREYILDGLNIHGDIALPEIVGAVKNFLAGGNDDPDTPRMNLLLSGPPGTGKTEFVKYLGKTLSVPVVTKMGSDILSMWVGGTEKNIASAFEEAESSRAILFFDEIDGLLQNRERAQRTWEMTQVNELLHRMENFKGVMIGATNFLKNLDPATARRFTFKLVFDYLDDAGKRLFFERMFHSELTNAEAARLAAIPNLAPGDFRTARQSLFYLGTSIGNDRRLAALEKESRSKSAVPAKKMGF